MTVPDDDVVARLDRIEHALKDKSLKKNGESVVQWAGRLVTNERVLLGTVVVLQFVFAFGGRVVRYEADLSKAVTVATDALTKATETMANEQEIREQLIVLSKQAQDLAENHLMMASKRDLSALDERLKLSATRADLRELRQMIIPRLERIEQAQKANP